MTNPTVGTEPQDLVMSRMIRAHRALGWKAWADPQLLKEWWCPKPWTTEVRAFDTRPRGAFDTFMRGPDGGTSDNPGCFLEVVPLERIVIMSTLLGGWRPATLWIPFTGIFAMADEGEGTRYIANAMLPDRATPDKNEEMGFFDG